jgi:hypothetical protein
MALSNFSGNTFVAFLDISGFKIIMEDEIKAKNVLNQFYKAGYEALLKYRNVKGLFVSDSGLLFVRKNNYKLDTLLRVVKTINNRMLENDIMLTTSISYGQFDYNKRIEFQGIEKNLMLGSAYLNAYLDNASGKPKIQPGQCRILKRGLPEELDVLNNQYIKECGAYYYYYWNVDNPNNIDAFKESYNDSYKLKYSGMLKALKEYNNQ